MPEAHTPLFDLILFDFDGTLAHSLPSIYATIQKVFEICGEPAPSMETVKPTVGMPLAQIMQILSPGIDDAEAQRRVGLYREWYASFDAEKTRLFPGVADTLAALRQKGFPLVVSSNKAQPMLEGATKRLGLSELFDSIVGIMPEYPKKPDPGFFTARIAAHAPQFAYVDPKRILIVGDAMPDLAFASSLGASSCYVTYGYGPEDECLPYGPRYVINHFSELAELPLAE